MDMPPNQHTIGVKRAQLQSDQGTGIIEGLQSPTSTCSHGTCLTPFGAAGQDALHRNDSVQGGQAAAAFSAALLGSATVNVQQQAHSASLADKVLEKQPYVRVSG
jgi:hypothetical protein